jgi:uncharacterized protein YdeI (YjbR/CyaY-like superfamily)
VEGAEVKITRKLCPKNRREWRAWLAKNRDKEKEIWIVYYKKHTGKPHAPYDDAVEEALCYGWIDSTVKRIDDESYAQRFTPRRHGSPISELNLERIRQLIALNKMTPAGMKHVHQKLKLKKLVVAPDIRKALKDCGAWENFQKLPERYKRIRIGWIEAARDRPAIFRQRSGYFVRMTGRNKRFGTIQ